MAAEFLSPLDTRKIGPQRWLLLDNLRFRSALIPGEFVAPRGFQTDLASIPRAVWAIFPKQDLYDAAAVIHDAAYSGALVTATGERIHLVKVWADRVFYEAMRSLGVGATRAKVMYWAVHRFGNPDAHPLAANRKAEEQV